MSRLRRPQIHFFHPDSWINDPNGLVFLEQVYHLFYQLNPDGLKWENIHWGHAISADFINWTLQAPALEPDQQLGMPFSGSGIKNDTADSVDSPAMLTAMYTRSNQRPSGSIEEQYIAQFDSESDRFDMSSAKLVIPNPGLPDFRDPKLWRGENGWHAVVAAGDHLRFYHSEDLIQWIETSRFYDNTESLVGTWECPDVQRFETEDGVVVDVLMVSIAVHDEARPSRVVFFVGTFNGESFVPFPGTGFRPVDYGKDFYATQSWSGLPSDQHIFIGWLGNWAYSHDLEGDRYTGCLSLPRTLELSCTRGSWEIFQNPVDSVASHFQSPRSPIKRTSSVQEWIIEDETAFLVRTQELATSHAPTQIAIGDEDDRWLRITVSLETDRIAVVLDRSELWETQDESEAITRFAVPRDGIAESVELRLFVDTCCIELFLDRGRIAATELVPWSAGRRWVLVTDNSEKKGGMPWELIPLVSIAIE